MTYTLEQLPQLIASMQAELVELRLRIDALERQVPDLLSVTEAAEMLDVHPNTIKTWIVEGRLPASKHGGRNWKVNRADVVAILESRQ